MQEPFVARSSPLRLLGLLVGSVAFVLIGVWSAGLSGGARHPLESWIGWVSILFFGFCAILIARMLFGRREQIVVDRHGILSRRWSTKVIPWREISDVDLGMVQGQRFLCLHLRNPSAYPPETWIGHLSRLNKQLGFGDIAVSATGTDKSFNELLSAIERYRR